MATWGPNSEELALLDATAGGTELPAGLAPAAVPVVPVVAVADVVAGAVVELAAGVAVVAVGFAVFDEFVVEVVVFATTGVSSAANAKLS